MYWGGLEQAGGLCWLQSPGPALGLLRLKPRLSLGLILHARHELASFKLALGTSTSLTCSRHQVDFYPQVMSLNEQKQPLWTEM